MRLLHARPNLLGHWVDERRPCQKRERRSGVDERQHLSLRRLSQHPGRDPASHAGERTGGEVMNLFSYTRANDVADAIGEVSGNGAAKFIAGGTNLIDLMKENVA